MKRSAFLLLLMLPTLFAGSLRGQEFSSRYPAYRLGRNDVLDVKYRYTPEFDQVVTIGPDGLVSLTGLGEFPAADLTVKQFQNKLMELSSKRLVNPVITVTLKEFDKPHVYVEGEVNTPGRVDFRSDISILDAIALAGGFKSSGRQSEVLLLRRVDGSNGTTRVVDVKKLVSARHLEEAVSVHPGDVIYVPQNNLSKAERLAHLGQFGAIYSPLR